MAISLRPDQRLQWGLAAAVLAFELTVLYLGLNPPVDDRYRAFYIDRVRGCLNGSARRTFPLNHWVELGGPEGHIDVGCRAFGPGLADPDIRGSWVVARRAVLTVRFDMHPHSAASVICLDFEARPGPYRPVEADIRINQRPVGGLAFRGEDFRRYSVAVPRSAWFARTPPVIAIHPDVPPQAMYGPRQRGRYLKLSRLRVRELPEPRACSPD